MLVYSKTCYRTMYHSCLEFYKINLLVVLVDGLSLYYKTQITLYHNYLLRHSCTIHIMLSCVLLYEC